MKVHFYMKSGAKITFDHISNVKSSVDPDGGFTEYKLTWDNATLPAAAEKLNNIVLDQIEAITTTDRGT